MTAPRDQQAIVEILSGFILFQAAQAPPKGETLRQLPGAWWPPSESSTIS
ncbi:hypothetical protein [Kribbella pittospori]